MIDGGTPQDGLNTTISISSLNTAVWVLGLPTMTRVVHSALAVLDHLRLEGGLVDEDIAVAEVARQPAQALHVVEQLVDAAAACPSVLRAATVCGPERAR